MYELQHTQQSVHNLAESIGHSLLRLLLAVEGLCGKHESHTRVSNSVSFSHGRPMFTRLIVLRSSSLHEITLATLFPFVTLLWYYNISSFLFYPHHWGLAKWVALVPPLFLSFCCAIQICREQFVTLHNEPILSDLAQFLEHKFGDLT